MRIAVAGAGRAWALPAALVAVALAVRVATVLVTPHYALVGDAGDYDRHAAALAGGHGWPPSVVAPGGGPSAFRPPAYPAFLAVVYAVAGHHVLVARLVQAVLATATVGLVGLIAAALWDRRSALVAAAIAAIYAPLALVGTAILSEALYVPLMLVAVLVGLRARGARAAAAAGALCGAAMLTRSIGFVVLAGVLALLWPRAGTRGALAAIAAAAVVVVPWTVRNAVVLGGFAGVSTETGFVVAGTYNAAARADPVNRAQWRAPWQVPDNAGVFWRPRHAARAMRVALVPAFTPRRWRRSAGELETDRRLLGRGLRFAARHPGYVAQAVWLNTGRLLHLGGGGYERIAREEPRAGNVGVPAFWLTGALALVGLVAGRRRLPGPLLAIAVLSALPVLFEGFTRFRAPIDPFVVLLAAAGVTHGLERAILRP